ncbi:MAG: DUF6223 family protein [Nocardiaceae bacterium]|nr:DUF6223 family protein [Nocardiaceae bacterium]
MTVRHIGVGLTLGGLLLASPATANASVLAASYGLTTGRAWSLVGVLLGLVGVVIGVIALARPTGLFGARAGIAVVAGLVGAAIGGLVVAAAKGGPGTGYGIVGGFVAIVVGVVGVALGGLAVARRAAVAGIRKR